MRNSLLPTKLLSDREVVMKRVSELKPAKALTRTHSKKQIRQIADSIETFGFINPILVEPDGRVIAGHGRVLAAMLLGLDVVPTLLVSHLSEAQLRAYVIADNRLAELAGWDREMLALELQCLIEMNLDFDIGVIGFEPPEIDLLLQEQQPEIDPDDDIAPLDSTRPAVTRSGDVWRLGHHRVLCGDARDPDAYLRLLDGERAGMAITDPPYNVRVDGHVCGLGRTKHREFAFASGEMSSEEFTEFLTTTLGAAAKVSRDGALHYVFMDWRHVGELLAAASVHYSEQKNLCVWTKSNAGMGSFYRSQHELVFIFKVGTAPHINNVALGKYGRYRTNVWAYAGANAFSADRNSELAMHPTVKPVALIADAILDASRRGDVVLDPFGGSGSTLLAAERTGRRARLIEYESRYVDTTIRRWQSRTGQRAVHAVSGEVFEDQLCVPTRERVRLLKA